MRWTLSAFLRTSGEQVDLLLQVGLPFTLQVDSCFRIVVPSLFTYESSVRADLDENGPPVMNQIARGGYSLTPPVGGTTRVPLASGLRSQTPPSSSTLEGSSRWQRTPQKNPKVFFLSKLQSLATWKCARNSASRRNLPTRRVRSYSSNSQPAEE